MAHNPNDGSNDNPDEFSELRKNPTDTSAKAENHREGEKRADSAPTPNTTGTPAYGDFGYAPGTAPAQAGTPTDQSGNFEGIAAPSTPAPEQRGSAPQNLDTAAVQATHNASEEERREAYKKDDPRYGGGTRNWESEEPANRTQHSNEDPNDNTLS
ncbi:hypothetical protein SAMN02745146_2014 [Hymenobacter daecheongensis DSM 21074]|uniref:Uncharacterized protein n=1 Tax=Hymenobacter daecheongensis DSM 21074 TaxID=1121955 RepID=A0A1M6FC65_9BACT|nr:hypothetical protein [Hymenobacter daecheongensis]SHI95251.1 hypothetical protein SAMN02745146_2014 [Hymenobacter daecheongensis DSM 21074]